MNKIKFTIEIETTPQYYEKVMKLQEPFYSRIIDSELKPMGFDEINQLLQLDKRKFYTASIQFPLMESIEDFEIHETNIKIKA